MLSFALHTSETAQWHALVSEAEVAAECALDEREESYLVGLLMRYVNSPALSGDEHSSHFLQVLQKSMESNQFNLQDIGDQCLILAGFFPEYALNDMVPVSHYVELGRRAYEQLAGKEQGEVFGELAEDFVALVDILQNMRELGQGIRCLDPMQAFELWASTGSRHAWMIIRETTLATPVSQSSLLLH